MAVLRSKQNGHHHFHLGQNALILQDFKLLKKTTKDISNVCLLFVYMLKQLNCLIRNFLKAILLWQTQFVFYMRVKIAQM